MKQGASIDFGNFNKSPWIILFLNYMMDKMDNEEFDGAIHPKNMERGWCVNETQRNKKNKISQKGI